MCERVSLMATLLNFLMATVKVTIIVKVIVKTSQMVMMLTTMMMAIERVKQSLRVMAPLMASQTVV